MLRFGQTPVTELVDVAEFQWAPTLGGECYSRHTTNFAARLRKSFNGHPPLGVNATQIQYTQLRICICNKFQWAPTLGGECYRKMALIS